VETACGSTLGVEVWEFYFEGCSLEVSSDDEWLWILCLQCFVFVKVSVLGGDSLGEFIFRVLFGGYGVPSICGTISILFRPFLASCGDGV